MDKKIAGLLGAVAALSTMGAAQAAAPASADAMQVNSYADLLTPVPNAMQALVADDAARDAKSVGGVKTAQISVQVGHHHHHHHRRVIVIKRHHHHSHFRRSHHHHSQFMAIPRRDA